MKKGYLMIPSEIMSLLAERKITPNQALVMSLVASFSRDGKSCYASSKKMGEMLGMSETTVKKAINELADAGYIEIERKANIRYITYIQHSSESDPYPSESDPYPSESDPYPSESDPYPSESDPSTRRNPTPINTETNTEINTSSSSYPSSESKKVEDKKHEEEDFLSKAKEIDSVSPQSSHIALYQQCVKRAISTDEALKVLDNAVKAKKRIPANFILTCLRNDDKLPLIPISSKATSSPTPSRRQIPTTLSPSLQAIKDAIEAKKQLAAAQ